VKERILHMCVALYFALLSICYPPGHFSLFISSKFEIIQARRSTSSTQIVLEWKAKTTTHIQYPVAAAVRLPTIVLKVKKSRVYCISLRWQTLGFHGSICMSLYWGAPDRRPREHDDETLLGAYEPELVVKDELETPPPPCPPRF